MPTAQAAVPLHSKVYLGRSYQEKDFDEAPVHVLDPRLPPRPLPLRLDQLAGFQQDHRAVGVGREVLLDEVPGRDVLNVFPGLLDCQGKSKPNVSSRTSRGGTKACDRTLTISHDGVERTKPWKAKSPSIRHVSNRGAGS